MLSNRLRIAIVAQRYGEEVSGGAELHARWLAEQGYDAEIVPTEFTGETLNDGDGA